MLTTIMTYTEASETLARMEQAEIERELRFWTGVAKNFRPKTPLRATAPVDMLIRACADMLATRDKEGGR